jgi:hypothetical protein
MFFTNRAGGFWFWAPSNPRVPQKRYTRGYLMAARFGANSGVSIKQCALGRIFAQNRISDFVQSLGTDIPGFKSNIYDSKPCLLDAGCGILDAVCWELKAES